MSATVEITEEDGRYTAVDSETGVSGVGKSRALALAALAFRLDERDGDITVDAIERDPDDNPFWNALSRVTPTS